CRGDHKGGAVRVAPVLALFEEAWALGESLTEPRVVYRAAAVMRQDPDRIEAGGSVLHIPGISRWWGHVDAVGAGICTVGEALEERVRRLWDERELPLAVMLDSVGAACAERLAEYANDLLCRAAVD